jgi:hypothetical protein
LKDNLGGRNMTSRETESLAKLREELYAYHVDVQRLVQQCEACRANVTQISTDIYGLPGNKDASPGLMGEVAQLKVSRKLILLALRGAWVLLTVLFGAAMTTLLK